jgi:homoserine dehydrogenase
MVAMPEPTTKETSYINSSYSDASRRGELMDRKRIVLVGYGNVGKGLVDMLSEVDPEGKRFLFSAVCSRSIGVALLKELPPGKVEKKLRGNKGDTIAYNPEQRTKQILTYLKEGDYDILIEATSADYQTAEPAISYIKAALERGIDVVTCNKGPIALYMRELQQLASQSNASLKFESTVMDGTPVFSLFQSLPPVKLKKIRGVFNSTTSIIIDNMREGKNFEQGLKKAKAAGVAETDPDNDLSGMDAAAKLVILCNALAGVQLKFSEVKTEPITEEALKKIIAKVKSDKCVRVRQVASADFERKEFKVELEVLKPEDMLFSCTGASNAAIFSMDLFGEMVIAERDPTLRETAFGIYSDIVDLYSKDTCYY